MIGDRWPLVDAATMRGLDRHTIATLGGPGELLMASAGRAVAEAVLALRASDTPVLVVCGGGNNGGDGLVTARQLHALGVPVRVALLVDPGELRGDPAANWSRRAEAPRPEPFRNAGSRTALQGVQIARSHGMRATPSGTPPGPSRVT